jgi:hypothetical protein
MSLFRQQPSLDALIRAIKMNRLDKVRDLLSHGVDVNGRIEGRDTPLICAAYEGHKEIVEELLKCPGIDADAVGNRGYTAGGIASVRGFTDIEKIWQEASMAQYVQYVRQMEKKTGTVFAEPRIDRQRAAAAHATAARRQRDLQSRKRQVRIPTCP